PDLIHHLVQQVRATVDIPDHVKSVWLFQLEKIFAHGLQRPRGYALHITQTSARRPRQNTSPLLEVSPPLRAQPVQLQMILQKRSFYSKSSSIIASNASLPSGGI